MECKTCKKEFYNPYVKTEYCSKQCESKDPIIYEGDKFIKEFFGGFNKQTK